MIDDRVNEITSYFLEVMGGVASIDEYTLVSEYIYCDVLKNFAILFLLFLCMLI